MNKFFSKTPMDIIVAEDESITRRRLVASLEAMGHTVRAFGDGLSAWEAFDGPELCRRVRAYEKEYTYFILVTAMQTEEIDYETASEAGTDDFLTKPLTADNLWRRLRVASRILGFNKEIGQLQQLIPICSYCRQVREDDNFWSNIEQYVQAHTASRFSHSICPQCYAKVTADFERDSAAGKAVKGPLPIPVEQLRCLH